MIRQNVFFYQEWNDPDLAWNDTEYNFPDIMLPVDKIWTPDVTVDNA